MNRPGNELTPRSWTNFKVLHRDNSNLTPEGVFSGALGQVDLFEYAALLARLLEPHPFVELVLSADWAPKFGFELARDALPIEDLRRRVSGSTFEGSIDDVLYWLWRYPEVVRYFSTYRETSSPIGLHRTIGTMVLSLAACASSTVRRWLG